MKWFKWFWFQYGRYIFIGIAVYGIILPNLKSLYSHYVDFPNCRVLNSYEKWKLTVKKGEGGGGSF